MQQDQQVDIVRAWKDPAYLESLPADARQRVPVAPDGVDKLSDTELQEAAGAAGVSQGIMAPLGFVGATMATANFVNGTIDNVTGKGDG